MVYPDTDVMIDILREYPPAMEWLRSLGDGEVRLSGYVCAELIQGCRNKGEQSKVRNLLAKYAVVWPDAETCDRALNVFTRFFLSDGLGIIDALIAQSAVDIGINLATFNTKHYRCVPGLQTYQPYRRETER
jgi:predicted nucleic acid-binding protein